MKRLLPILIILSLLWPAGVVPLALADTAVADTLVPGGSITTPVTWNLAGSPYIVQSDVSILSGGSLTIDPGVVVKFDSSQSLLVAPGGALTATGTITDAVLFTSSAGSPAPGDWGFIQVQSGGAAHLAHCDIAYGSRTGYWSQLEISSSDVTVEDCTIHHGQNDGIRLITNGNPVIAPTLRNLSIDANGGVAIQSDTPRLSPHLENLSLTNNSINAVRLGYTFGNLLPGAQVTFDGSTLNGAPLLFPSGLTAISNNLVTFTPGSLVELDAEQNIQVLDNSRLIARGTPSQPITFTTSNPSPAAGQWAEIRVRADAQADLDQCVIEYAGFDNVPALQAETGALVHLSNCYLHDNLNGAIGVDGEVTGMVVRFNRIESSGYGLAHNVFGPPGFTFTPIDARNNFWGSSSGPYNAATNPGGAGLSVSNNVLFVPWTELLGAGPNLQPRVVAPASANVGANFSFDYGVWNQGSQTTLTSAWEDAFYLSEDGAFDGSDLLLGTRAHSGSLAPGANYSATVSVRLPLVAAKPWYVLVVADHNHQSPDIDRDSNTAASQGLLAQVPSLPLNTPVNGTLPADGALYQFTPPADGNVRLSATPSGAFLLEESALSAPTAGSFEYQTYSGTLTLRHLSALPHYVWIKPLGASGNFSLIAQTFSLPGPLALASVTPGSLDINCFLCAPGTITLRGTGFTPTSTVKLISNPHPAIAVAAVYLDENTLRVPIPSDVPAGTYDVQVNNGAQSASLPAALALVIKYDQLSFQPRPAVPCQLTVSLDAPSAVKSLAEFPVTVNYENKCGQDLTPEDVLVSSDNARFRLPSDSAPRGQYLELLLSNQGDGPFQLIPQGGRGSILLMAQPITGGAHIDVPIDLNLLPLDTCSTIDTGNLTCSPTPYRVSFASYQPADIAPSDWISLTALLASHYDNTVQGYLDFLTAEATQLAAAGQRTSDVARIISTFLFTQIDPGVIQRQYLGALGYGVSDPTHIRLVTGAYGNYFLELGSTTRAFLALPGGGWKGEPGDDASLSVSSGIASLRELDGSLMVFHADGTLDYREDPNNNRLTANYSGGRLSGYTDSQGDTTSFTYEGHGRLSTLTDPVGRVTTFSYNPAGDELISISSPAGNTQFEYSGASDLYRRHAITRMVLPTGAALQFAYDALGRLTRQSLNGATNEALNFSYGANGQVSVTDALGHVSTLQSTAGFSTVTVGPLGELTTFNRDANGHLTQYAGPGVNVALRYDARGNLSGGTDALGQTYQLTYEPDHNRLARFSDPKGNVTTLHYDVAGNLSSVQRADGSSESLSYDAQGQLTQDVNRRGQALAFTYNALGLPTRKDYADGRSVLFSYNAHRDLVQSVQISGTTRLTTTQTYDGADRLTRVTSPNGRYVAYTYDSADRLATLADQGGFTLTYAYDGASRLYQVHNGASLLVTYTYDAVGRLARAQNGNNTATAYQYDAADRLTKVALLGPGDAVIRQYTYTYDASGRRLSMTTTEGTTTYTYDAAGRLISATPPSEPALGYSYDAAGNRTQTTVGATPTTYTTNRLNQYTQVGASALAYDADGNLTTQGTTTYQWDADGQLVAMSAPGETWTFEYDVFGNRTAAVRNGVRTEYLVDPLGAGDVLAEYDGSGALLASYVQGIGLVSRIPAAGQAAYYGFDGNGNTVLLTNAAGAAVNSYKYLPFGELDGAPVEAVSNPFRFGGKWGLMQSAALTYARARYYRPDLGRFVSEEPDQAVQLNGYTFAGNDPVNMIDINGLEEEEEHTGQESHGGDDAVEGVGSGVELTDLLATAASNEIGAKAAWLADAAHETQDFANAGKAVGDSVWVLHSDEAFRQTVNSLDLAEQASKWQVAGEVAKRSFQGLEIVTGLVKSGQAIKANWDDPTPENQGKAIESLAINGVKIALAFTPVPFAGLAFEKGVEITNEHIRDAVYDTYSNDPNNVNLLNWPAYRRWLRRHIDQRTSNDPNDLEGPQGFGAPGWIADQDLLYTIRFENMPTATASAATVLITLNLDANLDPASVRFLGYGFGAHNTGFGAPQAAINDWQDASADLGVAVAISATANAQSNVLTWRFSTHDPLNGGQPLDSLLGFLPPDNAQGVGEGYVVFSARAKPGKPTGTQLHAQAAVVFDANPPLNTNVYLNTLDVGAPTASVSTMPTTTTTTHFTVSWSGQDIPGGSGLASYNVWVAVNGGSFGLWQSNTLATSAPFTGTIGSQYDFVAFATDQAGNSGQGPLPSQASVLIQAVNKLFLPVVLKP